MNRLTSTIEKYESELKSNQIQKDANSHQHNSLTNQFQQLTNTLSTFQYLQKANIPFQSIQVCITPI